MYIIKITFHMREKLEVIKRPNKIKKMRGKERFISGQLIELNSSNGTILKIK